MQGLLTRSAILLAVIATPGLSEAAGFLYPDNGARALGRAGAFTALPSDPTALYHNPAGLSSLEDTHLLLEGNLVWLASSFQRFDPTGTGGAFEPVGREVSNEAGPGLLGFFAVSYQVLPELTVAAGVYAPASLGQVTYPDPRNIAPGFFDGTYTPGEEGGAEALSIGEQAPQRYDLIEQNVLLAYPSVSLGWTPLEWLSIGATAQVLVGRTEFSRALQASPTPGPQQDIIAVLDVWANPTFTGIVGILVRPMEHLTFGASFRPGFDVRHEGTLDLTFSDALAAQGFEQTANDAAFTTPFPALLRLGLGWEQGGILAEAEVVFQDGSKVDAFVVEPDIEITGPVAAEVDRVEIPRAWEDTWGLRAGGRADLRRVLDIDLPLGVSLGYSYEQSAIPSSTLSLDFTTTERNQIALGLDYQLGAITLNAAVSHLFQPTVEVRDSVITASTAAGVPGPVVGNGDYHADYTLLIVGMHGKFGG